MAKEKHVDVLRFRNLLTGQRKALQEKCQRDSLAAALGV